MTARNNYCCCLVKFLKSPFSNCGADGHGFYYTKQNKHRQFLMIGGKNMTARRVSCFCLAIFLNLHFQTMVRIDMEIYRNRLWIDRPNDWMILI